MKVCITLLNGDRINDGDLFFWIDWELPFLPRIGETIGCNLMCENLDPKKVYPLLLDTLDRENWEINRNRLRRYPEDQVERGCIESWLAGFSAIIDNITWGYTLKGNLFASIDVKLISDRQD